MSETPPYKILIEPGTAAEGIEQLRLALQDLHGVAVEYLPDGEQTEETEQLIEVMRAAGIDPAEAIGETPLRARQLPPIPASPHQSTLPPSFTWGSLIVDGYAAGLQELNRRDRVRLWLTKLGIAILSRINSVLRAIIRSRPS